MKTQKVLVLIFIFFLLFGCEPQEKDMKNAVRLKARVFVPSKGIDPALKKDFKTQKKVEKIHVMVQFDSVPGLEQRKILHEKLNLNILDPVPERTFFTAIPYDISIVYQLLEQYDVRWVGMIKPEDKVNPAIFKTGIPEHAKLDSGIVALIVEFFGDVGEEKQKQILESHCHEVLSRINPVNGWHISILENKILDLAANDNVKWLTPIPPPPEDLNDIVRSASGVNADPLHDPALEYNLTGAGIVIAMWETRHASFDHNDYSARITLGDPPLPLRDRSIVHDESVTVNGQYDNGENIYWDMDDDNSVSDGDVRATPVGAFLAGSTVSAGPPPDADVGTALVSFIQYINTAFPPYEGFTDLITVDQIYTDGEGIYLDNDFSGNVSDGDTRLTPVGTYATGSAVSAGPPADTDVGDAIRFLSFRPHYHSTHVAGTVLGDGSQSAANGGTPNQWQGMAPGATLRSYNASAAIGVFGGGEYDNAAANAASISTNSWSYNYQNSVVNIDDSYEFGCEFYDAIVSGRRSDGTASGLAGLISIFAAAANEGRPERHTEQVAANNLFDDGETIYQDDDDDGVVSWGDDLLLGAAQPNGTPLVNFGMNERHDESVSTYRGWYRNGEGIYVDSDASLTISAGDIRTVVRAGSPYINGSVVAAGDTDEGEFLREFLLWHNLAIPNSSKNTVVVGSVDSDDQILSEFSSKGPTRDGRVKPDVVAPGSQQMGDGGITSCLPGNTYTTLQGTSMSTPATAGSAALLEEWYKTACNTTPPTPDILKALLIHSAEDLTDIPNVGTTYIGPDCAFGYGRVRIKEAVDLLPYYLKGTANVGTTTHTFTIGWMENLKVTLVWDDPPWTANAAPAANTGLLQNDLDLLLIAPDGTQYTPWIIDPFDPFIPATRSIVPAANPVAVTEEDHLNNIEQVEVQDAMPGTWTIQINASTMNIPPQDYVIVSEALSVNTADCSSNPAADVWVKDNPTDVGTVPSTGSMYLGPDIWNRLTPDGLTSQENPEFGQINYLYANIRNASTDEVKSTTIDAWIGTLAVGLIWPDAFTFVGRFDIPNLGPGEIRQVGPIEWEPPTAGHYCMYTRVQSPQDPITFAEGSSVWTNAQNSNNIAYRNMTIVDLTSAKSVSFLVRNVYNEKAEIDIVVDVPDNFLNIGQVEMKLSPELEKRWPMENREIPGLKVLKDRYQIIKNIDAGTYQRSIKKDHTDSQNDTTIMQRPELILPIYGIDKRNVVLKDVKMQGRQEEWITLTFNSKQSTKAVYHVHVTQKVKGEDVGGILFVVRTGYAK